MSENEFNRNQDENLDVSLVPAYTEASSADGHETADEDFKFVQQDKDIHDTKFNTKPTTFFRDAMRRFAKNKSSVVGAIILGLLFIFAIILPIEGVLPFSIDTESTVLNYETNLPPKLFSTGTGFWDGTKKLTNQPYPYDSDGNYIGLGGSDACVVSISDPYQGYGDAYTSDGEDGYATVTRDVDSDANTGFGYMYSVVYGYNFEEYEYTVSFTLGWVDSEEYIQPEFDLLLYVPSTSTYYPLTNYSLEYGTAGELPDVDASVIPYETQTYSLNELIANNEQIQADISDFSSLNACVGLMFKASVDGKTAIYVHDFTFESSSESTTETRAMSNRSFDDANELVGQSRTNGSSINQRYWANNSSDRFSPTDVRVTRCDITYDMYEVKYGVNSITLAQSVIDNWVSQGLVEYTDGNPSSYQKTEAGAADDSPVYVESIAEDNGSALTANVIIWKYLGYDEMPTHLFGTDSKGRDMLKYVFAGLRTSLILGIIVALINILIGIIWGSISGYFGGAVDLVMERFVDILSGIPWIVLMTVLCIKLGQTFFVFALSLCLTGWISTESVTRSQFYRYKGREYVLAARTLGAKAPRLIFRHILPNAMGTIITNSILMVPSVIFSEATISYLGLGLSGLSSLGVILSDNQRYLSQYPYQLVIPAVIISLLMICFNLFGNGLRDAFNPSLKGSD